MSMQLNTAKEKAKNSGRAIKGLPKKFKAMSKKKKIIISSVAVVLIAAIAAQAFLRSGGPTDAISTARVERGDVSVIISGTGTVAPIDQYEITSLVKGEILSDTFEEGDMVQKGDLLYQIDSSDLENNLKKAQLNLQKSQVSYNETMDELSKLKVTSKYAGTITETYVKVGDSVNNGTKIADLVDMDTLVLSIPFNEADAATISTGSQANITLTNSFYTLTGTVRRVSSGTLISSEGATVRTVEIETTNPGAVAKGDSATATIGNIACNGPGTFDYNLETSIVAEASGKVTTLNYAKGDKVHAGNVVAVLESSTSDATRQNSALSLKDSQLSIESYNKQLEDYQITSPISGTVLKKTSKAGDTLDNSNSSVVMAVIADMSTIVFDMSVDELDVSKIEVGQTVSITADAIDDRTYTGYVDNVSVVGTTSNGVTTYPVRIVIENPDDLVPGMNVSAEIVVESRTDVLRIPLTAVQRGNMVYVKDDSKTASDAKAPEIADGEKNAPKGDRPEMPEGETPDMPEGEAPDMNQGEMPERPEGEEMPDMPKDAAKGVKMGNVPDGFRAVRVETGINDSDYIEIISGLSEGEEVYVPAATGSSSTQGMMGMGMGGMGGGMPGGGGGMPGGGGGMPGGGGGMPGGR